MILDKGRGISHSDPQNYQVNDILSVILAISFSFSISTYLGSGSTLTNLQVTNLLRTTLYASLTKHIVSNPTLVFSS